MMKKNAARVAVIVVLTTVLAGVFLLYWQPEMAFDVATKLWSCF
jgi:L-asparagine transporter-like permease